MNIPHCFIRQVMYGRNMRFSEDDKAFSELMQNLLKRDVEKEFQRYIKNKSAITMVKHAKEYKEKIQGIVNVVRRKNNKPAFRDNVTNNTFFEYVFDVTHTP